MENQREQGQRIQSKGFLEISEKRNFRGCQICTLKAKEVKAIENEMSDFEPFRSRLPVV